MDNCPRSIMALPQPVTGSSEVYSPLPSRREPPESVWRVVAAAGGDTFTAIHQTKTQIRICRWYRHPRNGPAAYRRLTDLVKGKPVTMFVEGTDHYGRLPRSRWTTSTSAGRWSRAPWPGDYTRYRFSESLTAAEATTRATGRGSWRHAAPVAQWEWSATEPEWKGQPVSR